MVRAEFLSAFLIFLKGCLFISTKELQINEEIRDKEIRVITDDGEQLGIMSAKDALKEAEKRNLDLVKIAPTAQPPVCKIMDYGKYCFDKAKKEKEARKNQKVIETKEIRLSVNIDTHDFDTKVNHALKFLKSGNKVKVSIRFRGREMAHAHLGNGIMERFAEAVSELGNVDKPAKLEGRQMLMFLSPKGAK
jgi:translation initiation factor IF-3